MTDRAVVFAEYPTDDVVVVVYHLQYFLWFCLVTEASEVTEIAEQHSNVPAMRRECLRQRLLT